MSGLDQPRERTAPLGVAVLGCGYWGVNYVRVMSELPGVRVVAVCDERIARLHEIGKRFPHAYLTPTLEDALQTDGVEAVVVCTGAQTHQSQGFTGRKRRPGHRFAARPAPLQNHRQTPRNGSF